MNIAYFGPPREESGRVCFFRIPFNWTCELKDRGCEHLWFLILSPAPLQSQPQALALSYELHSLSTGYQGHFTRMDAGFDIGITCWPPENRCIGSMSIGFRTHPQSLCS